MVNLRIAAPFKKYVDEDKLLSTCQTILLLCANQSDVDLSIVIVNDSAIRVLNRDYLGIDSPTDVLSFFANEIDPDTTRLYLGDVILSYQRVQEQSEKAGHTIEAEIYLLIIHGILHLLGYDHADEQAKIEMWSRQNEIIDLLRIEIKQLTEE